jgi:hypothetical protein
VRETQIGTQAFECPSTGAPGLDRIEIDRASYAISRSTTFIHCPHSATHRLSCLNSWLEHDSDATPEPSADVAGVIGYRSFR